MAHDVVCEDGDYPNSRDVTGSQGHYCTLIVQGIRSFGETYFEGKEPLEHFLASETACKAKDAYWQIKSQADRLKAERNQARNTAVWNLDFKEKLKKIRPVRFASTGKRVPRGSRRL